MIFRQMWIAIAVLLLLVGIGIREPAVAAVGALVALAGSVSQVWSRLSLERLDYERRLEERRAFVGEEIEVRFSLTNRKTLPLAWVEVRESVPEAMPVRDAHAAPSGAPGALYVTRSTSLSWFERVTWRHHFTCRQRGYFAFGPTLLRSGDIFGLFPNEREIDTRDRVIILPRVMDLPELGLPTERPFGEARSQSRLFEDPSRVAGVRDYRPGDPLKRIDWKATARRQDLQSRVLEPSSSLHLLVALNVSTLEFVWEGYDPVRLERAITAAASIAAWADRNRYAAGLVANSSFPGADRPISIAPGRDPDQLTHILEALAMISPFVIAALEDVLEETARRLPMGATVVAVAGYLPESLADRLIRLRRRGHPVSLVWVDDAPPQHELPGIPVYQVAGPLRAYDPTSDERTIIRPVGARIPPGFATAAAAREPAATAAAVIPTGAGVTRDERDPVARWARPSDGTGSGE